MSVQQFFYSLINIMGEMAPYILLGFLAAGILHSFVRPEVMSRHLSGNGLASTLKAALLGIPLPLCSCGVLPTAVALRRAGASAGATTSFLIATPQTGVDSIAATWSLLGGPMAVTRPIAALVGAVAGGVAVGRFAPDSGAGHGGNGDKDADVKCHDGCCDAPAGGSFMARCVDTLRYGFGDMIDSVGRWLVVGLVVAALITVLVPDELFLSLREYPLLAMLAMVVVAVPMYICATGSIPIALSLMLKGLSPGVAFVMLMAGPAANFASVMILRRTLGVRATVIYVATVVVTAIAFGLAIDCLLPARWFVPSVATVKGAVSCHATLSVWQWICTGVLGLLLVASSVRRYKSSKRTIITSNMTHKYQLKGLACPHCQANVEKAIRAIDGVKSVVVNLSDQTATVEGDVAPQAVIDAVVAAGYEYVSHE